MFDFQFQGHWFKFGIILNVFQTPQTGLLRSKYPELKYLKNPGIKPSYVPKLSRHEVTIHHYQGYNEMKELK